MTKLLHPASLRQANGTGVSTEAELRSQFRAVKRVAAQDESDWNRDRTLKVFPGGYLHNMQNIGSVSVILFVEFFALELYIVYITTFPGFPLFDSCGVVIFRWATELVSGTCS